MTGGAIPSKISTVQKTSSRSEVEATHTAGAGTERPKIHDVIHPVMWYRSERMSEQDESADMQTSHDVKLEAHGLNDPQLHRP